MSDTTPTLGRRRFMQATAVAAGGAALATARPVAAQEDGDFEEWFSNVSNYEGLIDRRGVDTLTIEVGAAGNGGGFAFGPAAVRVDPGTSVVWEWTGDGGSHNVSATDGAFESELLSEAGATFEHTFDAEGVTRYVCSPHEAMGMKGAIVVGDVAVGATEVAPPMVDREPDYEGWFDNTANFEGTVDMRGRDAVRIEVAAGDDGAPVFSPAAVHVDPGTEVTWAWAGDAGSHSVEAADGSYSSPEQATGSWGLSFDGTGISKYRSPTNGETMRGAVVVGDVFGSVHDITTSHLTLVGGFSLALLSPIAFGVFLWARGRDTTSTQVEHPLPRQRT